MKRYLCWLTILGVGAVPDWASAFQNRCRPVAPYNPGPVSYCPPQVVFVPPCVPVYEVPLPPPRVYVTPQVNAGVEPNPRAVAPRALPKINIDPPTVKADPVVVGPKLEPRPEPKNPVVPAGGPMVVIPERKQGPVLGPEPPAGILTPSRDPVPPLSLPKKDEAIPVLELPKDPNPAVPVPAPGPDPKDAAIPAIMPKIPEIPTPKPPEKNSDTLPPLVLPPEAGGNSVSKSSPLGNAPRAAITVQVFTATGAIANPNVRKVGFYNHTGRDIDLVIEGKAVTLPKKTFIHADVPPAFRWKYADQPTRNATIPDGAAGLDVLFRE